jgi:hypothetical protein
MNKQMRKLSEQAEKYADDNFKGEPTWSEAFESKFAELIINECALIVDNQGRFLKYDTLSKKIKKHFGVEE